MSTKTKTPLKHEMATIIANQRAEISQLRNDLAMSRKSYGLLVQSHAQTPVQVSTPVPQVSDRRALMERAKQVAATGKLVRIRLDVLEMYTDTGWHSVV